MTRAYLSLGSNVGDRAHHLTRGVALMSAGEAARVSRVYQSAPVGGVAQADFWNLVLEVETAVTPAELLARAHAAETAARRTREVRWGPRTLDVDIVWIDGVVHDDAQLTVPHPRMFERNFVLVPLRELRADLVDDDALARGEGLVRVLGTLESLQ